jgi:hypothetical protein
MPAYRDELVAIADKNHIAATDTNLLNLAQGKGRVSARAIATAHREAAAAAARNATALRTLAGRADGTTTSVKDLKAALDNLDGGLLSARAANRKLQQSFDDATRALKTNGRNLDINTQKGRDNQAALDDIAASAADAAKATLDAGGSAGDAAKIMANGRKHFIALATAMGMDEGKARGLAKALFGIPKNTTPHIRLTGVAPSLDEIAKLERAIGALHGKTLNVNTVFHQTGNSNAYLANKRSAAGGAVDGPGPKGIDSQPYLLAPGEHVLTAGEVDAIGGQAAMYRLRDAIRSGSIPRYAAGGAVPRYSVGAAPAAGAQVGVFVGDLYLDSGEFLGKVRGEVNSGIARHEHAKRLRVPR